MKRILFFGVLLVVAIVLISGGINSAIQTQNAQKAAQAQADMVKSQEVLDKLPDWGKTLILTLGALYGMETFGPKLLLVAGVTILGVLVIIIILLMQIVTAFSRPTHPDGYKYGFYNSLIVAGIVLMIGGYMLTNIPGGAALFKSLITTGLIFAFFAMGGGFGLRFSGGSFKSTTDEHGNTNTEAKGPAGGLVISGRNRTASNSDSNWKES